MATIEEKTVIDGSDPLKYARVVENLAPTELGYKELTSISTSVASALADVSGGIPTGSRKVDVEIENASVRWRADGTDPTTTVGRLLLPGDILKYDGSDLTKLKLIGVSAGAKLGISFYG